MGNVALSFGSIIVLAIVFYFVIKTAVKEGINESMLFSSAERKKREKEELYETFNLIGQEVPKDLKEYYERKTDCE